MNDQLDEYRRLLRSHDWYYGYSDDHSVWRRGQDARERLRAMRAKLDPDGTIWNSIAPPDCRV